LLKALNLRAQFKKHMKQPKTSVALLIAAIVMVTGSAMALPPDVPDTASTSMLLASSLAALAVVKRWIRR
jgi:hypothetical protein